MGNKGKAVGTETADGFAVLSCRLRTYTRPERCPIVAGAKDTPARESALAQSGRADRSPACPLSGVKRTLTNCGPSTPIYEWR